MINKASAVTPNKKNRTIFWIAFILIILSMSCNSGSPNSSGGGGGGEGGGSGKAGSMSRFAIIGDYLYAIAGSEVQLVSLENPSSPSIWNDFYVDEDIETLFPYEEYLFIGSETGVDIYENTSPGQISYISSLQHVQSCDPVVVEGNFAYVTLRSTSNCTVGEVDEFMIFDISDINNPELVTEYGMQGPEGLGVDDGIAFICDGAAGLKVFDVTDPEQIDVLSHLDHLECYDLIPHDNILIIIGYDALYQYSYSSFPMKELSSIPIVKDD